MSMDKKIPLEPEYVPVSQTPEERYSGFYETGPTRPPKSHGGLVAAVLLTCIFFSGVFGALTILNLRLKQMTGPSGPNPGGNSALVDTEPTQTEPPESTGTTEPIGPVGAGDGTALVISPTPDSVPNVTQEGGLSLQEIYKKVSPSVVSITVSQSAGTAYGSGIIMSADGYIITNCHVIEDAWAISVLLPDQSSYSAALIGKDAASDLAVLHIDAEGLAAAEFGDSGTVQVGDAVVAIGDPLGQELSGTMTDGIISAINRNLSVQGRSLTLLQTTAALNEGNSGGPLINCYGQVIGVNTAKIGDYYSSAGVEGLGFAIPMKAVKEVVDQLISTGYVPGRPSLGLKTAVLGPEYLAYYRLPEGAYVTEIDLNSDAYAQGVRPGDMILYLGEQRVTSPDALSTALSQYEAGDSVTLVFYRKQQQIQVEILLADAGA